MTGRVVLVALGAVGALLGLLLAAVGLVLLVLTGRGGFGGADGPLATGSYALVSDAAGLRAGGPDVAVRVRVTPGEGRGPVFVGVGPAAAVDEFLAGSAYDELTDVRLSPLEVTQVPSGGAGAPGRPADRPVWTVSAAGAGEQTVDVTAGTGGQKLVVMNADGSPGVAVTASLALRAAFLRTLALGLLGAGAVVAAVGGGLLVIGVRRTARARAG